MNAKFYLIRRNDGYVFLQRYVPGNYANVSFKVLSVHESRIGAVDALESARMVAA